MSLVFDHTKSKLSECMGMPNEQVDNLKDKLANITMFHDSKGRKSKSYTAEKIAKELSYNELIFISIGYIESIIDQKKSIKIKSSHHIKGENALDRITEIIKKIKRDGEN